MAGQRNQFNSFYEVGASDLNGWFSEIELAVDSLIIFPMGSARADETSTPGIRPAAQTQ